MYRNRGSLSAHKLRPPRPTRCVRSCAGMPPKSAAKKASASVPKTPVATKAANPPASSRTNGTNVTKKSGAGVVASPRAAKAVSPPTKKGDDAEAKLAAALQAASEATARAATAEKERDTALAQVAELRSKVQSLEKVRPRHASRSPERRVGRVCACTLGSASALTVAFVLAAGTQRTLPPRAHRGASVYSAAAPLSRLPRRSPPLE